MAQSRSSKSYRERAGIIPTRRGPTSRLDLAALKAHSVQLSAPLPAGESLLQVGDQGNPSPDRGATRLWPAP